MSFFNLAKERYSVRSFNSTPIPEDVIKKILKAGYVAPTGCNYQPQRILVINTEQSIAKLRKCTRCHFDAPAAMLVCYNKDECWYRPYDGTSCGVVDASIVATHLMMQATDLGVGTTWVMHFRPQEIRREFCIPSNIEPVALLVMGYASDDAKPYPAHTEFKAEDEIVVYDSF